MRRTSEQVIPEELTRRVADLTLRVAELMRRLELYESTRGNGNGRRNQKTDAIVRGADDSSSPIEFITENGFSIVRPWESGKSPAPANGKFCFRASDALGIEREVTVHVSNDVVAEISLRTRGRIQPSSPFWVCCAERHLANYVSERDDFPDENELMVAGPDREDILLALRWEKSD